MCLAARNDILIETYPELLHTYVKARIEAIINLNEIPDHHSRIKLGLTDPIRLFIKQEPHKREKLDIGRYRLISSISVIDQVIDKILFFNQNNFEIENWSISHCKGGLGLSTDQQQKDFYANLRQMGDLITSDVSGWDWNWKEWMWDMHIIKRLMEIGHTYENATQCLKSENFKHLQPLEKLIIFRIRALQINLLCLSDGTLITHGKVNFQKSGGYDTLNGNSFQRSALTYIIAEADSSVTGDDCAEESKDRNLNDVLDSYTKFGFKVTDLKYSKGDEPIEFCSHYLYREKAVPQNEAKIFFKYLNSHLRYQKEQITQILNDLRNAPHGKEISSFIRSLVEEEQNKHGKTKQNKEEITNNTKQSKSSLEEIESY